MLFLVIFAICANTCAQNITQLQVPLYADPRRAAELSCVFRMGREPLHSVKWYRDSHEIFRYTPSQQPAIRLFNVTGISVEAGTCELDACTVRLMPPPVATRAAYSCEVSTEGPRFQIARQTKHMTVVAMPERDPTITGAPSVVRPGEEILLNCTSDSSLPPADINWYIDGELQKPDPWLGVRTELGLQTSAGLRASWRGLRVRVGHSSGALNVRCEASLRVQPPVLREAAIHLTVYSHARLSKFVSNNAEKVYNSKVIAPAVLWTLLKISKLMNS